MSTHSCSYPNGNEILPSHSQMIFQCFRRPPFFQNWFFTGFLQPFRMKKKWDKALKWTSSQLSPGAKRSSANLKNCVWQLYQNCTPLGKKKNFTALAQPDFAILSNVKHLLQWCKDGKACLWGNSRRCERIANESRAKKVSW